MPVAGPSTSSMTRLSVTDVLVVQDDAAKPLIRIQNEKKKGGGNRVIPLMRCRRFPRWSAVEDYAGRNANWPDVESG